MTQHQLSQPLALSLMLYRGLLSKDMRPLPPDSCPIRLALCWLAVQMAHCRLILLVNSPLEIPLKPAACVEL